MFGITVVMHHPEEHINDIDKQISAVTGQYLSGYTCFEYIADDGQSDRWDDMPLQLFFDGPMPLSIAWSHFDNLWCKIGTELPFDPGENYRKCNNHGIREVEPLIGQKICSFYLGKGQMTIEDRDVEIWTRLLLCFEGGQYLEIYNKLDENGYMHHKQMPNGDWINAEQVAQRDDASRRPLA